MWRDVRRAAQADDLDLIASAFSQAELAREREEHGAALPYLRWARSRASRSAALREALGVAAYEAGEYEEAAAELAAYRRLTGRHDQNHLIADCHRAAGRPERVRDEIDRMLTAGGVSNERRIEGLLVLAGTRADAGDPLGALGVLRRADLRPTRVEAWHPRVWYLAAELALQLDDRDTAREYFEAAAAVDPDFLDVAERAEDLRV